jgi:hypothetical protein
MHLRRLSDILEHGSTGMGCVEGVGPALQLGAAALLHLVFAGREAGKEGVDVGADAGRRAKAGVGGHLFARPSPDMLTKTKLTPGRCISSAKDWAVSSSYTQVIHSWARCFRWSGAIVNAVNGSG